MLQVVARAVDCAVLVVEAHRGAVVDPAMSAAARQVGDDIHMRRGQQVEEVVLVVANVHSVHFFDVLVD